MVERLRWRDLLIRPSFLQVADKFEKADNKPAIIAYG